MDLSTEQRKTLTSTIVMVALLEEWFGALPQARITISGTRDGEKVVYIRQALRSLLQRWNEEELPEALGIAGEG